MDARKKEMFKRLAELLEERKIVIPSRFPVEELFSAPRSDAYHALKFACFRKQGRARMERLLGDRPSREGELTLAEMRKLYEKDP